MEKLREMLSYPLFFPGRSLESDIRKCGGRFSEEATSRDYVHAIDGDHLDRWERNRWAGIWENKKKRKDSS